MPGTEITEQTIDETALDQSLEALLKAAGAEDTIEKLNKGGQVYSGHYDERGKVGGGGASSSDAGGLETMMIGKLVAGGMDGKMATQVVGDMMGLLSGSGFVGKQKGDEDEDEDEDDEDEEMSGYARGYMDAMKKMGKSGDFESDDGDDEDDDGLQKSHRKEFVEDSQIAEAVDASPFMDQLVSRTTRSLDGMSKSIRRGRAKQDMVNAAMARALYEQGQLIKSQQGVISELGNRLGMVESQPAPARGARTAVQAQALAKSMPGEAGGGSGGGQPLTKSQAASVLSYLRFEKGLDTINGEKTGDAACRAEAGGILTKSMGEYIDKYLTTHPNEREVALNYA